MTLLELLLELEWCIHDYDPAHSPSYSCPICGGASRGGDLRNIQQNFGHADNCEINKHIKTPKAKEVARRSQQIGCYECAWGKVAGCWRCGSGA